jgi:L-serine dehydratase
LRFKDVFSIIGPGMVGPSSSHTAGAVRLGRVARALLGEVPVSAEIMLYGSFAETYRGHGTDLAIVGGLLDYDTDDERIPQSLDIAEQSGLKVIFKKSKARVAHPNTVKIKLSSAERSVIMIGSSIGGGNIEVSSVNDFDIEFTGSYPTLLIFHIDRPGLLADVTRLLSDENVNIGYMDVDRKARSGEAMTAIEVDSPVSVRLLDELKKLQNVHEVRIIDLTGGVES